MVVAGLAAALLTEMRHALCLWLTCAPLLTSTPLRAPHALRSSQQTPAPATASLSSSRASVPERPLPPRPFAPCSSPPTPFPPACTHQIAQVFREALERVCRLGFWLQSPVSDPLPPTFRAFAEEPALEVGAPLQNQSFSFYALQVAFGFLVELGRKLPRGAGYASPDPGLGGLERKLAPPHGLSPLQHPCRLAGGQAASRLPALSSQPYPA